MEKGRLRRAQVLGVRFRESLVAHHKRMRTKERNRRYSSYALLEGKHFDDYRTARNDYIAQNRQWARGIVHYNRVRAAYDKMWESYRFFTGEEALELTKQYLDPPTLL
jgi:hypothetical protein